MNHHAVAHIDAHMGHRTHAVIGLGEKDEVTGLCLVGRYGGALIINARGRGARQVIHAGMGIDPADEAGAVEGGLRRGAAPE